MKQCHFLATVMFRKMESELIKDMLHIRCGKCWLITAQSILSLVIIRHGSHNASHIFYIPSGGRTLEWESLLIEVKSRYQNTIKSWTCGWKNCQMERSWNSFKCRKRERKDFCYLTLTGFRTLRHDALWANGPLAVASLSQWAQWALLFTINRLVT